MQRAQKDNRFLRGRPSAFLVYEYFRPTGSYDGIQGLSVLFSIKLENDDNQYFDLRWEQALLSTSDPPSDNVFGRIVRLQVVRLLSDSDNYGNIQSRNSTRRWQTRLSQTENVYIEQAHRSKNFRIQNAFTERGDVTKGEGQNSFTKRKTGECFQWKATGSCSRGESCSFRHMSATGSRETTHKEVEDKRGSSPKPAVGNREHGRKEKEQASSSGPKVREETDEKRSRSQEAGPAIRGKIPCLWGGRGARCNISSCGYRHPPVCHRCKSGNGCIYGHCCQYRHADGEEKPSKRSKTESTQGAVAILRQNKVQGCVSQN